MTEGWLGQRFPVQSRAATSAYPLFQNTPFIKLLFRIKFYIIYIKPRKTWIGLPQHLITYSFLIV